MPRAARSSPGRSKRPRSATSRCRCWRPAPLARLPRRGRSIERSFPVDRFEPLAADRWQAHYRRFKDYVELASLCLMRRFESSPFSRTCGTSAKPRHARRTRSNCCAIARTCLGEDLRITNFGGGNTSAKFELADPLTGQPQRVMAVKGSGGDLRSIAASGFAVLYLDKLEALIARYRGEAFEDEMVGLYPLCAFGENRVAASIDTPLHAFLPFPHVDHLHPDWAIALAASANGAAKLRGVQRAVRTAIAWLPWQRPGFELALMLRDVVAATPGCDGVILGGHGLFTWGARRMSAI